MRYVTLLLSGVPQNVPLIQLSSSLDQLFDTNEIGTFELRDLPKQCGKRQIALDFHSGFDAIEAQKRLDGYHYELSDGCEYTLCAKITRKQEFLRTGRPEPDEGWAGMALVPYQSEGAMFRVSAKLDAQLELLRKQKLVLQTEREVLREKKKLERDYSSKSIIDSDEEATSPKRYRRSRFCDSSSSRERSSSQELKLNTKSSRSKRLKLRSKSREPKLLAIKSSLTEPGAQRSRSRDRNSKSSKKLHSKSRERRTRSRDRSRSREPRSPSRDPELKSSKKRRPRPKSRDMRMRSTDRELKSSKGRRSNSRDTRTRSRDRDLKCKKLRSQSKEPRSPSRDRELKSCKKRRSKSRDTRMRSRNRELKSSKKRRSKSRDTLTPSRERGFRSPSRDRGFRTPSRDQGFGSSKELVKSRELRSRSRDRDRDLNDRSPSWDIDSIGRRSREFESRNRRSRSRDYASGYYKMDAYNASSPREWDIIGRSREERSRREPSSRSRKGCSRWDRKSSPEPSFPPLAIMPRTPVRRPSPNERESCVPLVDYNDEDDVDSSCYYKRSYDNETPNNVTSSLESHRNCTVTSDNTANKEERAPIVRRKKITINIDLVPQKTAENDKNKTIESDKNKIGNSNVDTNPNTNQIVSGSVNEIENQCSDANKNTEVVKRKLKKGKKLSKAETERSRIASEDAMFLMETLLDEMSIKENIIVSETRRKILNDKLKLLIHDRITPLAGNENSTSLDILLRYRELYKKQDDVLLIKKLLGEIPEDKNSSEGAGQMAENIIFTSQHYSPVQTEYYPSDHTISNTTQIIEIDESGYNESKEPCQDLDKDRMIENQLPITVINLTQDTHTKKRPAPEKLPKRPQFVLVIKRLMNQMKQSIKTFNERTKEPFPTFQFKHVLRSILKDIVMGKGYMSTSEIVNHFRDKHPKADDDEFLDKALEEIKTGKYGAYVIDVEDDENDVLLIEKKYDVVTVLDSDDEQDELMEKIDNLIKEEPVKSEVQLTEREEAEPYLQSQDQTSTSVISEVPQVDTNNSELKEVTIEKEATANTDIAPDNELTVVDKEIICNDANDVSNINERLEESIISTERETDVAVESLLASLKDVDGLNIETINKHVSTTNETLVERNTRRKYDTNETLEESIIDNERETDVAVESLLDSLKDVDGLYIETINQDVSNTDETLVETKTDLTDVAVENLLDSLKDIDGLDNANATETPQVTGITIMTSYSELCSLQYDNNKNTCKEVTEIKKENEFDVELDNNNEHDNEQTFSENIAESLGKDSEIAAPAIEDINNTETTITNEPQHEEECIESISKYVESFWTDIHL